MSSKLQLLLTQAKVKRAKPFDEGFGGAVLEEKLCWKEKRVAAGTQNAGECLALTYSPHMVMGCNHGEVTIGTQKLKGHPYVYKGGSRDLLAVLESQEDEGMVVLHVALIDPKGKILCALAKDGADGKKASAVAKFLRKFENHVIWDSPESCRFKIDL